MSALFARIVKQAFITFDQSNVSKFRSNFNALKSMVDLLTPNDLNLDPGLMQSNSFYNRPNKAPVTYLEIFEHETFTMSVFIVANRYTMPLHDHPGFGMLKVISGTARIQSYSLLNASDTSDLPRSGLPRTVPVIKEALRDVSSTTECSVLTPTKGNIHEITAVGAEPAAFFDILSPPYESALSVYGPKKCSFFRRISIEGTVGDGSAPVSPATCSPVNSDSNESDDGTRATATAEPNAHLQTCNTPPHYYCDTVDYYPPEFLLEYY